MNAKYLLSPALLPILALCSLCALNACDKTGSSTTGPGNDKAFAIFMP